MIQAKDSAEPAFPLEEATIVELQEAMQSGQMTARRLTEMYIERIQQISQQGPHINAVLEINPEALESADQLDRERQEQGPRGILHGIPILIKDNIATADEMQTTAGSLALLGSRPPRDAFVVQGLRKAGAIILGKTNLSEWANFRSDFSSSGWSGRGGQGRNPYVLDRSPCGSSAGSAQAIAANLAAASLGTETDGSIVCPSSLCSIVGIKPTLGLVSRAGVIPIAHSQDIVGPMCRTVADAAAVLGALVGIDAHDPTTEASDGIFHKDYTKFLEADGLRGARIGVARQTLFGYSPKADAIVDAAIERMKELGAIIVDPADIPTAQQIASSRAELTVLLTEFKADLNSYLAELVSSPVRSLAEIIAFNNEHVEQELPYFGQDLFLQAEATGGLDDPAYLAALAEDQRLSRQEGIDAVMNEYHLDALVAPTCSPPWTIDLVDGDHFAGSSSTPPALAGYPAISVPAGYVFEELPVGITFFGRAWSEPTLIKLAYAFEQATRVRHAPKFIPSLPDLRKVDQVVN
ncbi:MAG TPA: amidase [Ktedonobacteraceae bacterium]|jgi:amidase|nr:amidase [Ktedonobacteraceae bacterium]